MIFLIQQYYISDNEDRQKEINTALQINSNNKYIDKIYLLNEKIYKLDDKLFNLGKIEQININERLTYKKVFEFSQNNLPKDSIKILSNSDISFDDTLEFLHKINFDEVNCLALNRWNIKKYEPLEVEFFDKEWAQDTWIFKDIEPHNMMNFFLGYIRCDNHILFLLKQMGYTVSNPSKTIKTYHHHITEYRPNYKMLNIPLKYTTVIFPHEL